MAPRKEVDKLWTNRYRDKILAAKQAKKREINMLRMRRIRAENKTEAAAAAEGEDGPPVTKKARVEGVDGTGKEPTETNAGDTRGRRRKTATKSDKPAQVRTTRRNIAKDEPHNRNEASNDETTNGKEGKETEADSNGTFDPASADLPNGEGRTSRRRNKKTKEPAANIASTQALETGLAKDNDDVMVISADEAPTSIALANGTEGEVKVCTENFSAAHGHNHVEVEPQATQSVSATECLVNQPLLVIVSHSSSNYIHQERCSSIFDSCIQVISNSIHQEEGMINGSIGSFTPDAVFTSLNSNFSAFQQGCAASGVYGQPARSSSQCQGYEVADQVDIAQEDACYTDETQITQDDKHVEVEPQATQSVSATECLVNQPLIVNMFYINENHVNQGGFGNSVFAPNTQSGPSTSNESVFFGVEPTMRSQEYPGFEAAQQDYGASGSYGQLSGWTSINNINQRGSENALNAPNNQSASITTSNESVLFGTDSTTRSQGYAGFGASQQGCTSGDGQGQFAEWSAISTGDRAAITQAATITNQMTQGYQHLGTSTVQTATTDDTQNSTIQSETALDAAGHASEE